jgi:hypothetical protein
MLVGGGQTPEVKNKQGYKILAQNYMHLEYEGKGERATFYGKGYELLGYITRENCLNSRVSF